MGLAFVVRGSVYDVKGFGNYAWHSLVKHLGQILG